ncbi:MAG: L,D-transpeptidase [Rhodoblastus sp.]
MRPSKITPSNGKPVKIIRLGRSAIPATDGRPIYYLDIGFWRYPCSIGRSGLTRRKREGDGCTPIGRFAILAWRFRSAGAVHARPQAPWRPIHRSDGWCDDPFSGAYNSQIKLPSRSSHEDLWRLDNKYDAVGILNYNIHPRRSAMGSAIFFHLCSAEFEHTAGCIAVTGVSMNKIIPLLSRYTVIVTD